MHNWREKDKKTKTWMKEYDLCRRLADPVEALIRGAKKRAKLRGHEFSMIREDLGEPPEFCPVLGLKLTYNHVGRCIASSPSIDRFDNTKGYVSGNVRLISNRANELKNNGTLDEFKQIIRYMENG